jgi:AcrR family transcriptional regulator
MAKAAKSKPRGRPRAKSGKPTDARLVAAAAKEFNQRGFDGTDTNRIARRAGFAPQTFYRWFRDKTEVFLAVYRAWEDEERAMLSKLLAGKAPASEFVEAAIKHHKAHKVLRRSLRTLALENPVIRKARTESRKRQIEQIKSSVAPARSAVEVATILLQMERLADAIAEGEFSDLGLEDKSARMALAELQNRLHKGPESKRRGGK